MTKSTKWHVRPAKPRWSESSLCTHWVAKDPRFLHVDSKDSDLSGRMPRLIWVFAGLTSHFVGFVVRWLKLGVLDSESWISVIPEMLLFVPEHDKINKISCSPSEDRLAWASAESDWSLCALWVSKDQTGSFFYRMLRSPYSLLRMLPQRCSIFRQPGLPALYTTAANDEGKKTSAVIFDMGGVLLPSPLLLFKSKHYNR